MHSRVARFLGLGEPVDSGRSGLRGLSVFPQGHGFDHHVFRFTHVGLNGGYVPISKTELYWFLVTVNSTDPGK